MEQGTTLFLDIDGVLNASRLVAQPKALRVTGWDDWERHDIYEIKEGIRERFAVWTSQRMVDSLVATGVDIVWATTWINFPKHLQNLAVYLNLAANLAAIEDVVSNSRSESGKLTGVQRYVETHGVQKFVWIDDHLGKDDIEWAEQYHSLLIKPSGDWGVTSKDVDEIGSFSNY